MSLEQKISEFFIRIDGLEKKVERLEYENLSLRKKVISLEDDLDKAKNSKHKKTSHNSSTPPSNDQYKIKPNQSLRIKSNRKSGGQKGHKGNTLKMSDRIDHMKEHRNICCTGCGNKLLTDQVYVGRRQVIDIPSIVPIITEHRIYETTCTCGKLNRAKYPSDASSQISYGNSVESLIGYLSVRQYLPMERMAELLEQVFNLRLSQGTISNKLKSLSKKCKPAYELIKSKIAVSPVVGADETGCVVNGLKHWVWTWQNNKMTYISVSDTRGYRAITDQFPNGLPESILISDCWAAQLKTPSKSKQICLAHIQRELKYFIESCKNRWSRKFLNLIYKALSLKKKIILESTKKHFKEIQKIINQSTKLLNQKVKGPPKLQTLKNRLSKNANSLWVFLEHINVPPDNNGSERAIRNIKVKQKISGQFRSAKGAIQFASIRSVLDTANKNNGKLFQTLDLLSAFSAE